MTILNFFTCGLNKGDIKDQEDYNQAETKIHHKKRRVKDTQEYRMFDGHLAELSYCVD